MKRISKVLDVYPGEFKGLRILELGGGFGDIGAFFASLGAEVLSLEGRRFNQRFASIKHRDIPGFKSEVYNLEEDFTHFGKFDLIINFGFLEMVTKIESVMDCCTKMSDAVFVETMVMDSTDPKKMIYVDMGHKDNDDPLGGLSARPSPYFIEAFFEDKGFKTQRLFHKDLNTDFGTNHVYDWVHTNSEQLRNENRRFWYFTREPLKT
jgi:hypothetical protein